jgi:hypothetical protein
LRAGGGASTLGVVNRARACAAWGVLVVTAGCALAARARADDEAEPIALTFRASAGCPDEARFVARVRALTERARFVGAGEAARTFAVDLVAGPPARGSIRLGSGGERNVAGQTCDEVADAVAMILAVGVDPRAGLVPAASSPAPASASAPAPAPAPAPASASASASAPAPTLARAPSPPPRAERAPTASPSAYGSILIGADLAVAGAVTPATLAGGAAFVGWQSPSRNVLSPSVRLTFARALSGTVPTAFEGATARFTWLVGRVDACPIALHAGALRVEPCARVEVGTVEVASDHVPRTDDVTSPWLAAGALLRAVWTVARPLFLEAEAGALLHVTSDRFFLLPDITVYQVPLVGGVAGLGLGVRFP